jgi:hypothetical protein
MNRMWLGAVAVLALVGCGGGGGGGRVLTEVDWVNGNAAPVSLDPGTSDCVQYGGSIPAGAQVVFDIYDDLGDNIDASVVAANAPCDGSSGAGLRSSTSLRGTLSGQTAPLAAGTYDLAVSCFNAYYPCQLTVDTFGYLY